MKIPKLFIQQMVECPRDYDLLRAQGVPTEIIGCRTCCEHYRSDDGIELDCGYGEQNSALTQTQKEKVN